MFHFEVFFLLKKKKKRRICALSTDWGVRVGKRRDPGCDGRLGLPAAVGKASRGRVLHILCLLPLWVLPGPGSWPTHNLWDLRCRKLPFIQKGLPMPSLLVFWAADWVLLILWGSCIGFLPSACSVGGDQACPLTAEDGRKPVYCWKKSGQNGMPWKVDAPYQGPRHQANLRGDACKW